MQRRDSIESLKSRLAFLLLPAVAVILLDQLTKYLIVQNISPYDSIDLISGFFRLVYTKNRGMAFGLLNSGKPGFVSPILSAVNIMIMAAIIFVAIKSEFSTITRFSFGLVLGGAAGNLIDRMAHGYVVDFLDLYAGRYHWPAFNVADAAITIGAILLIADTVRSSRNRQAS